MMQQAVKILKGLGLHITNPRLIILNIFLTHSNILDHKEVSSLCKGVDRITLYRTLQLLYQHHLVIKVPSSDGIAKYIYRGLQPYQATVKEMKIPRQMIHLICQDCGTVISRENVKLRELPLPKDFQPAFIDLIVNGKCKSCSNDAG